MNDNSSLIVLLLLLTVVWGCQPTEPGDSVGLFENPAVPGSKYPRLYSTGGAMYMSWLSVEAEDQQAALNYAVYSGDRWSKTQTVAQDSGWFINWADFPSVIADEGGPAAAHWLNKKAGGTYAYDINISFPGSEDSWKPALAPHTDSTATEHGFVSMIPWNGDAILAIWLDGRRSENRTEDDYFNLDYAMTLRGALISNRGKIKQRFLIDDSVCDCCQTSLVKTPEGAMVAYRNRTGNEIRDIAVSRFNGKKWTTPQTIHNDGWKIGGCPVNGPALASHQSLTALAWHTGANDKPMVKAVISTDGGLSFQGPKVISTQISQGRVDVDIYGDNAYISWLEQAASGKQAALNIRTLNAQLQLSDVVNIDSLPASRQTGFPQLEILGNQLMMAWTDISSDSTSIITVKKKL